QRPNAPSSRGPAGQDGRGIVWVTRGVTAAAVRRLARRGTERRRPLAREGQAIRRRRSRRGRASLVCEPDRARGGEGLYGRGGDLRRRRLVAGRSPRCPG